MLRTFLNSSDMNLVVEKFGGSSVANRTRIEACADRIIRTRKEGSAVAAVVSAMYGETNRLLDLARQYSPDPSRREVDALISTGEQVSSALLAMVLQKKGCPARSFTGTQIAIVTEPVHGKARVSRVDVEKLQKVIADGIVPVIAGFQGIDEEGNVTTLGRGGSDTTAVAIAAALEADECRIYSDVDGIFTADPNIVPDARVLEQITIEEILELAGVGAKVLQIRAVEFAFKYRVPMRVLSSFKDVPGTSITLGEENMDMEQPLISGIAYNINEAKFTIVGVPDRPGIASQVFSPIADAHINVDMIIQNIGTDNNNTDLTFTIDRNEYASCGRILDDVVDQIGAKSYVGSRDIAKISVVGVGMRSHTGIATKMFTTLANEGINIQMISTSEIKISVIVDEKYAELGVRALHDAFNLSEDNVPDREAAPQEELQD